MYRFFNEIKLMQTIQDSEMKNKMLMIWDKCKLCERHVYSERRCWNIDQRRARYYDIISNSLLLVYLLDENFQNNLSTID